MDTSLQAPTFSDHASRRAVRRAAIAVATTSALALSGCVAVLGYDQSCAEIELVDSRPTIYLSDGGAPTTTTTLSWFADELDSGPIDGAHSFLAVPTTYPNKVLSLFAEQEDDFFIDSEDTFLSDEDRARAISDIRDQIDVDINRFHSVTISPPIPTDESLLEPNAWTVELDYNSILDQGGIAPLNTGSFKALTQEDDPGDDNLGLPDIFYYLTLNSFHLPVVVGVTCGYSLPTPPSGFLDSEDYADLLAEDGADFESGLIQNLLNLNSASAAVAYPGLVSDQITLRQSFDGDSSTLAVGSETPGAYPVVTMIFPWFEGLYEAESLLYDEQSDSIFGSPSLGVGLLDPIEQYWWLFAEQGLESALPGEDSGFSLLESSVFISQNFWGADGEDENLFNLDVEIVAEFAAATPAQHYRNILRAALIKSQFGPGFDDDNLSEEDQQRMAEVEALADEFIEVLGEPEYYLTYAVFLSPDDPNADSLDGFSFGTLSYSVQRISVGTQTSTPPQPPAQLLPSVSSVSPNIATAGSEIQILGERLNLVEAIQIDGQDLDLLEVMPNRIRATLPESMSLGTKDLILQVGTGTVRVQAALSITQSPSASTVEPKGWVKRISSTEAKLYMRDPVGAGKVQFLLNGAEIGWVRAVDQTDPKLRTANSGPMVGRAYFVRTAKLEAGRKNVLEVYVDGERVRRVAYGR